MGQSTSKLEYTITKVKIMARKMKVSKQGKEFSGLSGWEVNYIKQAKKYGHLDSGSKKPPTTKKRG